MVRNIHFAAFLLLGYTFLFCSAYEANRGGYQDENSRLNRRQESLKCYDCNSEYDPRCGDPFNPYTIGIINCTDRKPPEPLLEQNPNITPTVCRKIVQKVEGRKRVIRGCGYLRDERDDKSCVTRSGTANVHVSYCACTKSLCNTGHYQERPSFRVIVFTVGLTLAIKRFMTNYVEA